MRTKQFFAKAASKALALAATVMMMSMAFTACSSDNNDDPKPGLTNTVTFDGVEKTIVKAEYQDKVNGNYFRDLYLAADGKEKVEFVLNKDLHMNGNLVKLTEREKKHEHGEWYWSVDYNNSDNSLFTNTYGDPDSNNSLFNSDTLTVTGDPQSGNVDIQLENGRVKGNDDKEHTLTISYNGKMTESGGGSTEEYVDLGLKKNSPPAHGCGRGEKERCLSLSLADYLKFTVILFVQTEEIEYFCKQN